ncbi:ATP-binding protein [Salinactinospora qingdaonensis]|uniref:BTAD domain-containing putative transcriptional regulator n=1 Tax=Salinactinospora qingdaonensis TaxID=702744 RepID=A0ABP7EYI1_9ACTN
MRFAILGPLAVYDAAGASVPVGGTRLRAVLALLLLQPGRTVSSQDLIDGIWEREDAVPAAAANALQALISRLRKTLGQGASVIGEANGYRLDICPEQVDLWRFESLVEQGRQARRSGDTEAAERFLRAALDLWRGPILSGLPALPAAAATVARATQLRRSATEERLDLALERGRHREALPEIEELVAREPLREQPVALLIRALAGCGRQAEAIAAYDRLRGALAEELGIDPSTELRDLYVVLLRGELDGTPAAESTPAASPAPLVRLPRPLTSFIGRDTEVQTALSLVAGQRLVTFTGPGGSGKTRLSIETGAAVARHHPRLVDDGVWFVDFSSLTEPAELPHALLGALGLRERTVFGWGGAAAVPADPTARLTEALAHQQLLLVLDNCEHLVTSVAWLVTGLLSQCPGVRVLATSREPLGVAGERLLAVPSLELPPPQAPARQAMQHAAVRLFAERISAVVPDFTLTDHNVEHVVRICRELDGLPLALELAAARARAMSLAQLADRLSDRFRLLTTGDRLALPRHQTLQAVVDWSWDLLGEAERILLRRLSVFAAGPTLSAVERVCGDAPGDTIEGCDVWDTLFALIDKSLVLAEDVDVGDSPRYRMLQTVRAYGAQRLAESGEEERVRAAHADHIHHLLSEAEPQLRGPAQLRWLAELKLHHDDLSAALRWSIDRGDTGRALELFGRAGRYWEMADGLSDAIRWAGEILGLAGPSPPPGHTAAYVECVVFAALADPTAESLSSELARCKRMVDEAGITPADRPGLLVMPLVLSALVNDAPEKGIRELAPWSEHHDPWLRATARSFEGNLAAQAGWAQHAHERLTEALAVFRRLGDHWGTLQALTALSEVVRHSDVEREEALLWEGIDLVTDLGLHEMGQIFRIRLATARAARGDIPAARAHIAQVRVPKTRPTTMQWLLRIFIDFGEAEVDRFDGRLAAAGDRLTHIAEQLETTGLLVRAQMSALCLTLLSRVCVQRGHLAAAHGHLTRAWHYAAPVHDAPLVALVLEGLAALAVALGEPRQGATLLGYATATRGAANETAPEVAQVRTRARALVGDAEFTRSYQAGAQASAGQVRQAVQAWLAQQSPMRGPAAAPKVR